MADTELKISHDENTPKKINVDIQGEIPKGVKINSVTISSSADKMNTSSSKPSGKPAKEGATPHATQDNFTPIQHGTPASNAPSPVTTPAPVPIEPQNLNGTGAYVDDQGRTHMPYDDDLDPRHLRDVHEHEAAKARKDPSLLPPKADGYEDSLDGDVQRIRDREQAPQIPTKDLREQKKKKLKEALKEKAKKKKVKIIAGGLGLGGAFFLLMLIMFLLGTLLIPHFMSNILEYQFVRLTRAGYESTQNVMDEQMADATKQDDVQQFEEMDNGKENPMTKALADDLTPDAINEAAAASDNTGVIKENVKDGKLESVTVQNTDSSSTQTDEVKSGTEGGNIEEPSIMKNPTVAEDITTAEMKVTDMADPGADGGGITYQQEVKPVDEAEDGIEDNGITNPEEEFPDGESDLASETTLTKDTNVLDTSAATAGLDSNINTASSGADQEFQAEQNVKADVTQEAKEDGNFTNAFIKLINGDFVESAMDSVASEIGDFLNPASGKLIPLCMIYTGSKFNGPTAQAQSTEQQRSAVQMMAISDQQKRGSPYVTASMVGAVNWKINGDPRAGGVQDSIPIERSSGEKYSTTSQLSSEGSPLGNLQNSGNILAALGIPGAGPLASVLDKICPAITNLWVNLGLGIGNLTFLVLAGIFTGGAGDAADAAFDATAEAGGTAAADAASETIVEDVVSSSVTDEASSGFSALKDFGNGALKIGKVAGKTGKQLIVTGGLVATATFLAKFIVLAQSGILNSGITTGPQFDDNVDQGTNQLSNAMVANAYGGRPLTNTESLQVQQDNTKILAKVNEQQSAYQRYLALANPQSLASIMLDRVAINLNYGFFSSVLSGLGNIFNPASLVPQVFFGNISGQANAASNIDTTDYGDVQQGYSDQEYATIAANPTYKMPSENEYYLYKNPSEEATIEQTYSPCFTESVATLLANNDIIRDAQGNVNQTQGLCSPQNLGPNNPQYGDLVFRYRLSLGYTSTIDSLEGLAYANGTLH